MERFVATRNVPEDRSHKLAEDQLGTLYSLYQGQAKGFRTTFFTVAVPVTLLFLLVFYPYVTFRGEKYRLQAEVKEWTEELGEVRRELIQLRPINQELREVALTLEQDWQQEWHEILEAVEDEVSRHERKLGAWKSSLRDDPAAGAWARGEGDPPELSRDLLLRHPRLREARNDPCFWSSGVAFRKCRVAEKLKTWHQELTRPFRYARISHTRNHLLVPLGKTLDEIVDPFLRWLYGTVESWRPDGSASRPELRSEAGAFFQFYRKRLHDYRSSLMQKENGLERTVSNLESSITEHKATIDGLDQRIESLQGLESISTPFGEIPVGLNELVLLFPLLLAGGFFAYINALAKTFRLRDAYHRLCRRQDPTGTVFTQEHIALVAPLWLDPLDPPSRRWPALVALAVPAFLFLAAVFFLLVNRLLWGGFMDEARLTTWLYVLLYLLAADLIFEGFRRLWKLGAQNG